MSESSLSTIAGNLKHLVLSQNQLTQVPTAAIKSLKNLDHLNLNHNQITGINDYAFDGLSKVSISLIFNFITGRILGT